jgi:hypothetical protein
LRTWRNFAKPMNLIESSRLRKATAAHARFGHKSLLQLSDAGAPWQVLGREDDCFYTEGALDSLHSPSCAEPPSWFLCWLFSFSPQPRLRLHCLRSRTPPLRQRRPQPVGRPCTLIGKLPDTDRPTQPGTPPRIRQAARLFARLVAGQAMRLTANGRWPGRRARRSLDNGCSRSRQMRQGFRLAGRQSKRETP